MNCKYCGEIFQLKVANQLYCSSKCQITAKWKRNAPIRRKRNPHHRKIHQITCSQCKQSFLGEKDRKFCSTKCSAESRRVFLDIPSCLENASRKIDKNLGYVRVYAPMHPEANTWGYVYEHRLIAEQMIGRRLVKNEIVHHKNGKRWD